MDRGGHAMSEKEVLISTITTRYKQIQRQQIALLYFPTLSLVPRNFDTTFGRPHNKQRQRYESQGQFKMGQTAAQE